MKLVPFSSSPTYTQTLGVHVNLERQPDGFRIEYIITGDGIDTLQLAPTSKYPSRRDELWKHTCFEVFFGVKESTRYYEFNGSPSGDWALYRFDDYRQGMAVQEVIQPPRLLSNERQSPEQQSSTLHLVWHIPDFCNDPTDRASITAVLCGGEVPLPSYWALKHAGAKPDFHLAESFFLFPN